MRILNSGAIYASSPFTSEAISVINSVLGNEDEEWFYIDPETIWFSEYPSACLDVLIDELVDRLGDMGFGIQGRIDYSGDYEGAYIWRTGRTHEEKTQSELAIVEAGDQVLIEELERRGLQVEIWREAVPELRGLIMH